MHPTYSMMSSHGTSFAAHDGAQHHNLHPSHSQQHRQVLPPPPPGLGGDQQHYQQPMLSTRSAAHPSHPACFQPQVSLQQLADAAAKKDATVAAAAAKKKTPMKKKPAQKAASSSKTDPGVSRSTTDSTVDQSSDPHRANVHNPNNPLYWSSRGMAVPADLNAAAAEKNRKGGNRTSFAHGAFADKWGTPRFIQDGRYGQFAYPGIPHYSSGGVHLSAPAAASASGYHHSHPEGGFQSHQHFSQSKGMALAGVGEFYRPFHLDTGKGDITMAAAGHNNMMHQHSIASTFPQRGRPSTPQLPPSPLTDADGRPAVGHPSNKQAALLRARRTMSSTPLPHFTTGGSPTPRSQPGSQQPAGTMPHSSKFTSHGSTTSMMTRSTAAGTTLSSSGAPSTTIYEEHRGEYNQGKGALVAAPARDSGYDSREDGADFDSPIKAPFDSPIMEGGAEGAHPVPFLPLAVNEASPTPREQRPEAPTHMGRLESETSSLSGGGRTPKKVDIAALRTQLRAQAAEANSYRGAHSSSTSSKINPPPSSKLSLTLNPPSSKFARTPSTSPSTAAPATPATPASPPKSIFKRLFGML